MKGALSTGFVTLVLAIAVTCGCASDSTFVRVNVLGIAEIEAGAPQRRPSVPRDPALEAPPKEKAPPPVDPTE